MDERLEPHLHDVVVEAVAKPLLGRVLAARRDVHEAHALTERVRAALDVQALEQVTRQPQLRGREVLGLGTGARVDLLHETVDRDVVLAVVLVRGDGVAVHLARQVPLDGICRERRRRRRRLEVAIGHQRTLRQSRYLRSKNGFTCRFAGLYMRMVACRRRPWRPSSSRRARLSAPRRHRRCAPCRCPGTRPSHVCRPPRRCGHSWS